MSKQLRLDVAQLTDVGRKRPHNEDNMAYVIPKDPQVMARKGALFIVADGMGGHAAGEVASEIAVDTVSKVYYQDDSDDAAVSLLHAIKRANALIHQRAAENMMRSGMGTTCVAAVFRGGTAYVANVGDSRSYLVRRGVIKQVSQDHSWVEEQVRAGLLTREQARSHAQRNVITRCLGTQPDVEIDVFSERLEEGDSMFLCSDGLSGLVSDEELGQIVDQYLPQESVYHLVERANENGGSDNITAVVVRVQEVGWDPPSSNMPRPVGVGGREADEDTAVIGQFRGAPLGALPARPNDTRLLSGPLRMASGPLPSSPELDTAPQAAVSRLSSRRNRLLYPTLAIFVILVISLGGAAYYWIRGSHAQDIDASLTQTSTLITQAKNEVNTNPGDALQKLNQAQARLAKAQEQGNGLSDTQRTQASTLQGNLTTATKQAILSYDQQSHILPLPCTTTTQVSTLNEGNTNTHASSLVAVHNGNKDAFYVLGEDHNLYQLNDQMSMANKITLPGNAQPLMITANDTRLLVLASLPAQGKDPAGYALYIFLPNGKGQANATMSIDATLTKDGGTPSLITTSGSEIYVVLTSQEASTSAVILDYTLNGDKFKDLTPRKAKISVSAALVSIAALKNTQLFFLLANGNVQSQQFAEGNLTPVSVVLQPQPPLAPTLSANPQNFQATTPVPVPAEQTTTSLSVLSIPRATQLAAALVDNVAHLYIMDDQYNRVLDLKMDDGATQVTPTSTPTKGGAASSTKMVLVQQYASPVLLAKVKSLVIDPAAPQLYLLTQGTDNNAPFQLAQVDTRPSDANTCAGA